MNGIIMEPPSTPPHFPLHNVRMTPEALRALLTTIYPSAAIDPPNQLPSGQSFNNRIYHVKVDHGTSSQSDKTSKVVEDLVLKLNGRFFGPDKVQNEVACLRLMEIHCPEVPAPRVRAWSDDGNHFTRVCSDGETCDHGSAPQAVEGDYTSGWILMTRTPGESLQPEQCDESTLEALARQLAGIVACWRRGIPRIQNSANLLLCDRLSADLLLTNTAQGANFPGTRAQGLIGVPLEESARTNPASSLVAYYIMRLESAIYELSTNDALAPNRHLIPIVRRYASETLSHLPLDSESKQKVDKPFIFTHRDISPRNILISGSPPTITGVVDYEFSGFFPATEEFVQDHAGNAGDWPKSTYQAFLKKLEELGVDTPLGGFDKDTWSRALSLDRLTEYIAPWWLPGHRTGEVLQDAFKEAEHIVLDEIKTLGCNI